MTTKKIDPVMRDERSHTFVTIEPGVKRTHRLDEFRVCAPDISQEDLKQFMNELAELVNFIRGESSILVQAYEQPPAGCPSLEALCMSSQGGIRAYYWPKPRLLTIHIQAHGADLLPPIAKLVQQHFGLIESAELALVPESIKEEHSAIEVRGDSAIGHGVFAKRDIKTGEFIGGLYGQFHEAPDCMALPAEYRDHVMQCAEQLWRGNETEDEAVQYLNHSCDPNTGVQGLFDFVAMRDIKVGEELTTDYAMQDDSNWVVPGGECLCEAATCRGDILPYRDLSDAEKKAYARHVSHWILHRYNRCSCTR